MQEEREAYERHSQVDVLSGFDLQRPGKFNLNLDRAFGVSDESSSATMAEVPISPQDANALNDRRRDEQPSGDVAIHTGKRRVRRQMTPNRVGEEHGQCLMRTRGALQPPARLERCKNTY